MEILNRFLVHVPRRVTLEGRMDPLRDTAPPEGVTGLSYRWNNLFGYRF